MLGLMFGNGMYAVLSLRCKLLLHKELVLPRQVTSILTIKTFQLTDIPISINVNHTDLSCWFIDWLYGVNGP